MSASGDCGQAFALEGIIAAVIVASALILGLQAVDIEPLTSGDERTNEELRTQVEDALELAAASETGTDPVNDPSALREAATCIRLSAAGPGQTRPSPASTNPDGTAQFGAILDQTIDDEFDYRVVLEYPNASVPGGVEREILESQPADPLPTQPTVTVTRQVPLYDSDRLRGQPRGNPSAGDCTVLPGTTPIGDGGSGSLDFYVDDQHPDSELYAVVQIRVIAW